MTAFRSLVVAAILSTSLLAQCDPQWQPGDAIANARGRVNAVTTWDPDGTGPLGPQLVVGGLFEAGLMVQTPIAAYDGSQWLPMGTPPIGTVSALGQFNGLLVAAFRDTSSSTSLWTWNGTSWQTIAVVGGPILGGVVKAIASYNGELYVGGSFGSVGALAASNIARWNGASWSPLVGGVVGDVRAMAVFSNQLYVGGAITQAGGIAVANLTAWNGSSFAYTASFNGAIDSLATYSSIQINGSRLFAGGAFTTVSAVAAQHIAAFTPATNTWSALGAGLPGTTCTALLVTSTGLSYHVTAAVVTAPLSTPTVWSLQAGSWVALGTVNEPLSTLTPTALVLFAGQTVLGMNYGRSAVRRFDAGTTTWPALVGQGIDGDVLAVCAAGNEVVIGGLFKNISGVAMNGIARGTSNAWQPLGAGVDGNVRAVTIAPNGDLIAGGSFATAGGVAANNIARWNGATWTPFGSATNGPILALCWLPDGELIAAGSFNTANGVLVNNIARWDGSTWHALGTGTGTGTSAPINALAVMPNGDLIAGGSFLSAGGVAANYVARWNGTVWSPLGSGVDNWVQALAVLPNGQLAVGGAFSTAGGAPTERVAKWNGGAWSTIVGPFGPASDVYALASLPDGDVVAGGSPWPWSASSPDYTCLARYSDHSGPSWGPPAISGDAYLIGDVLALTTLANGDLIVVGGFPDVGGFASGNVARFAPSCRALATAYGAGCTGSGGANVLTATSLPWTGSTYRGLANGMPAFGFAIVVTGFASISLPIVSVLPQGLPGCSLLVAPDFLDVVVPSAGSAATQVVLPDTVTLAGLVFDQQVVPFALDAVGNVLAITSTNALQLTIGTF